MAISGFSGDFLDDLGNRVGSKFSDLVDLGLNKAAYDIATKNNLVSDPTFPEKSTDIANAPEPSAKSVSLAGGMSIDRNTLYMGLIGGAALITIIVLIKR